MSIPAARRAPFSRLLLLLAVGVVAALAGPLASADAAYYAAPDGSGPAPCPQSDPCNLEEAVTTAPALETVLLKEGTYEPLATIEVRRRMTIEGEAGGSRPLIDAPDTTGGAAFYSTEPVALRDLRIHTSSRSAAGFNLESTNGLNTVERVEVTGEGEAGCWMVTGKIRDSLCEAKMTNGEGIGFLDQFASAQGVAVSLSNVTAVGGRAGIEAYAGNVAGVSIYGDNTIASGDHTDVLLVADGEEAGVAAYLVHSSFAHVEELGEGSSDYIPNSIEGNVAAPPVFVDAASGDYREDATSPTVRAGAPEAVESGELDLDGDARTTVCEGKTYVDIGAYELAECPPALGAEHAETGGGGSGSATPIKGVASLPEPVAPKLTKLALKPPQFAVTGKKKGTTISFSLSESATVKLEVLARKNGKGKPVVLGTLPVVHGHAHANKVKFAGRLKGKALAPGKYTLRATATLGGLKSTTQTKPFRVIAPAT